MMSDGKTWSYIKKSDSLKNKWGGTAGKTRPYALFFSVFKLGGKKYE